MWPPGEGLITHYVPRTDGVFAVSASTHIDAPASLVLDVIRQVSDYGQWNTWCPNVTSPVEKLDKGTIFTFHVIMDASKPQKDTPTQLIITDISTPEQPSDYVPASTLQDPSFTTDLSKVYRIAWKGEGGFAARGLRTERFHEMIVLGEAECEVRTWEVMGGVLAHTVKWFYKKALGEKFELWCSDLKKYSEQKYNDRK